jgi:hypothetical protein
METAMRKVLQVRRLRFVPLNRTSSTRLKPGDHLEVVRVRPAREYNNGRTLPERVVVQAVQELSGSEFDIIATEQ